MLKGVIFDMDGVIINSEPQHYLTDMKGYEQIASIKELIKSLYDHNVKLAIVSSSPRNEIMAVVESLGIERYFTKLLSEENVENPKPAPDIFLKAAEDLNLNVEECIIIEDSENGVKAANAAKIPVIVFVNPESGNQDLSKAAIVVEGFEEIDYTFVNRIYQRAYGIPWRIVETARCVVRESVIEDLEKFYDIYNTQGMEYIEPMADYETEKEKLQSYIESRYPFYEYGMWTVLEKESGKVIGRAGIEERVVNGEEKTELGYMLHYLYRRNGIGTEICQAMLDYAKTTLYIEEIYAFTHPQNVISQKMLIKLGFQYWGEVMYKGIAVKQYYKNL